MTIVSAIDARGSYPALVIADLDARRWLFVGSLRLAAYEKSDQNDGRHDLKIVVSDQRIAECVDLISEKVSECRVETIEIASSARELSAAFSAALSDALPVTRSKVRFPRRAACETALADWPTHERAPLAEGSPWQVGSYPLTLNASWLVVGALEGALTGVAVGRAEPSRPAISSTSDLIQGFSILPRAGDPELAAPANDATFPVRTLGVFPGSTCGIVVVEPIAGGLGRVYSRALHFDVDDADERRDFVEGLVQLILSMRIGRVVINRVANVHGGDRDPNAGALAAIRSIASSVARSNWIGGLVEGACLAAPNPPALSIAPSGVWRQKLKIPYGDVVFNDRIRGEIAGWPETSSDAERNAAGIILWDRAVCSPPPEVAVPGKRVRRPSKKKAGPPAPRGAKKGSVQTCKKCGAPRRGHVCSDTTPVVQTCRKCGLPRRGHVCEGAP